MQFSTLFTAFAAFAAVSAVAVPQPIIKGRQAVPNTPSPTQAGVASNCNRWDFVNAGDTCQTLVNRHPGLTLAQIFQWNPATGSTCTSLWAGYYVCTSVSGGTLPSATPVGPPASTFSAVPPQQTSGPILPAPGQTQAGVTRNCRRWDFVAAGVTCNTLLARYPGITLAQLVSWNPAIGSGCNTMWAEYYVCTLA